jgi:hypothetical protein
MEIAIIGEGEVVIRFIDRHGRTLLQERFVVSGPPGVQALRQVPLSIGTVDGPAELAPVITSVSSSRPRVTFDGEAPTRFVRGRSKAIGCIAAVMRDAARGKAPAPVPQAAGAATISEPPMGPVLRAALRRTRPRR